MPLMSTANWRDEMIEGLNDRGVNKYYIKKDAGFRILRIRAGREQRRKRIKENQSRMLISLAKQSTWLELKHTKCLK